MSRGEARTLAPEAAPGVRGWLPNATRGGDLSLRALVMPTVREAATQTPGAVFGALSARASLGVLSGSFDVSGACVDWGCPSAPWTAHLGLRAGLFGDRDISSRDPKSNQRHPPDSKRRVPLIYLKGCRGGYRNFS